MYYCEVCINRTRQARTGDTLKVAVTRNYLCNGIVLILVSTADGHPIYKKRNVCVDLHQVDIGPLSPALQEKLQLAGREYVRCTGSGHEQEGSEDGFYVNDHTVDGEPAFITLLDLIVRSPESRIKVLGKPKPKPKVMVTTVVEIVELPFGKVRGELAMVPMLTLLAASRST